MTAKAKSVTTVASEKSAVATVYGGRSSERRRGSASWQKRVRSFSHFGTGFSAVRNDLVYAIEWVERTCRRFSGIRVRCDAGRRRGVAHQGEGVRRSALGQERPLPARRSWLLHRPNLHIDKTSPPLAKIADDVVDEIVTATHVSWPPGTRVNNATSSVAGTACGSVVEDFRACRN